MMGAMVTVTPTVAVQRKPHHVTGLYICYWSLMDPLCQTQSLAYLRGLTAVGHRFALMTFEQKPYLLDAAARKHLKMQLREEGIYWYPLRYHKRPSLLATAYDVLSGVVCGTAIVLWHRPQVVHSRSTIPASIAIVLSRLFSRAFLYDADSRLSQEYVDCGHWDPRGIGYRLTAAVEQLARRSATQVVVLSRALRDDFRHRFGVRAPITVIPCCVDTSRLFPSATARAACRRELHLENEKLLVYVGKSGPRYLLQSLFTFYQTIRQHTEHVRLLIVSRDAPDRFHCLAAQAGVDRAAYTIRSADLDRVADWLSSADAGLCFLRPTESERGASPIKLSEYLASGLPIVVTSGIGDTDEVVNGSPGRGAVGVVVQELSAAGYRRAFDELQQLWNDPQTPERCRTIAHECFDLKNSGWRCYRQLYESLLGRSTSDHRLAEPAAAKAD